MFCRPERMKVPFLMYFTIISANKNSIKGIAKKNAALYFIAPMKSNSRSEINILYIPQPGQDNPVTR